MKKTLCIYLLIAFLVPQLAFGSMMLSGPKVVYRGTITGLRISSVNGTAFLDACAAITAYADGKHQVEVYDSARRFLRGVLKLAGDGEDLGGNIVTNGDFSAADGWTTPAGWVIGGNILTATAALTTSITSRATAGLAVGSLTKTVYDAVVTAGNVRVNLGGNYYDIVSSTKTSTYYYTRTSTVDNALYIKPYNADFTGTVDNVVVTQVTGPTTNGCTIVSAKEGTIYNFAYKNASFAYEGSYYVIVKEIR